MPVFPTRKKTQSVDKSYITQRMLSALIDQMLSLSGIMTELFEP